MCFRQRDYSERDPRQRRGRQCTDGKHFNQDCARAYIKQQHFEKRPCKELKLKIQFTNFTLANVLKNFWVLWGIAYNGLAMSSSVPQGAIAYRFCVCLEW